MPRSKSRDSLDKYREKRNFSATPEPAPKRTRKSKTSALQFVIQKHAASHLHYDFRLELEGALKSWAVPKGPSLDPHDKRLAMHVEDHPLDYANFEGVIPEGNYGAGTVIVWDNGEWEPIGDPIESYRKGRMKFFLRGKKLTGIWNLVRSYGRDDKNKNAWLLIKHNDDAARSASEFNVVEAAPDSVLGGKTGRVWKSNRSAHSGKPAPKKVSAKIKLPLPAKAKKAALPLTQSPQLAMLADRPPTSGKWTYEIKYDGYRILTRIDGESIRLFTRNGNDWTSKLSHIAKAIGKLPIKNGWLDGEIIVLDANGQPSFQKLQNAFENARTGNIQYFLFDLLYANDHDLRNAPLIERRAALQALLKSPPAGLAFSETFDEPVRDLFKNACEMKLEGLIGKRADAPYHATRSRDWIKLKCIQRQEFVIGGWTDPGGSRTDFGSLLLGVHDTKTGRLRYAGRVGTGFTDTTLRTISKKLKTLARETMPFDEFTGEKSTRGMHWVEPKLVGEVAFTEWTADGHLRHPSFQGLRTDKLPTGITQEKTISAASIEKETPRTKKGKGAGKHVDEFEGVEITHGDRVIDAANEITKLDIVRYYAAIAPIILEHLKDRPVSLVRAPAGIDGKLFFQKHLDTVKIPNLRQLDPDFFPGHPPLIAIDSRQALIACAQMNVIELHTLNATTANMKKPDRIVFDLDPGEGVVWEQIQQAAELVKALLTEIGLNTFLKTSGGKGLHIFVPIKPEFEWDEVKNFSEAAVRHLAKTLPSLFVAKSGPRNRVGRIFIDYLRNGFGATTACAFTCRARPGCGVSVPIPWSMLSEIESAAQWTVNDVDEILDQARSNPWKSFASKGKSLIKPAAQIGFSFP